MFCRYGYVSVVFSFSCLSVPPTNFCIGMCFFGFCGTDGLTRLFSVSCPFHFGSGTLWNVGTVGARQGGIYLVKAIAEGLCYSFFQRFVFIGVGYFVAVQGIALCPCFPDIAVLQELFVVSPLGRLFDLQFSAHFQCRERGRMFFEFFQIVSTGSRDDVGFPEQYIDDKFVGLFDILDSGLDVLLSRNSIVLFLSLPLAIKSDGLDEL